MSTPDYSGHDIAPSATLAKHLSRAAIRFRNSERRIARTEAILARRKAEHQVLREVVIPELMEMCGTTLFRLEDGTTIEIVPELYARIPEDSESAAFEWLEKNGHGGIIKRQIIVAFNKNEEAKAAALRAELAGKYSAVSQKSDVHWQTLTKWVKERLAEGEFIDPSIAVAQKDVAKIK